MPLSLLMALFVAFGLDDLVQKPIPADFKVADRFTEAGTGILVVALLAVAFGRLVAFAVARKGYAGSALRKRYALGLRLFELTGLLVYAWIIHWVGWASTIRNGLGLPSIAFLKDGLILLPYILIQVAIWFGTFPAEIALRSTSPLPAVGWLRHLILRTRYTLGLALPALFVYSVGPDLISRQWPDWSASAWAQPVEVLVMGLTLLAISPLFLRIAWPTRPLEAGPLRSRLEQQARRVGFRYSDILVWDTGNGVVNACVTGSLPWFRYVLLSDALLEYLNEHEVAAVFGHELGHIAHRHLVFFGVFIVGSLGVLAMFDTRVEWALTALSGSLVGRDSPIAATAIETVVAFSAIGIYALVVFGHISRRFERQADVFGCRAVSCFAESCPPHADVDRRAEGGTLAVNPCPVGIRIFANALANVASLNGIDPRARSWRHGSIARRIAFIETLESRPEQVRRFQVGVLRLRVAVGVVLGLALVLAMAYGTFPRLR
ncbi:M48 family metallopeptidase [Singulisphaera sp. PoT]|uniref:M48 family metallopeptidase n=1 Tax=Singulisphaera sp. PoT TaxID=3411797 RepID=UPI003BF4A8AE